MSSNLLPDTWVLTSTIHIDFCSYLESSSSSPSLRLVCHCLSYLAWSSLPGGSGLRVVRFGISAIRVSECSF